MSLQDYLTGTIRTGVSPVELAVGVRKPPVRRGHLITIVSPSTGDGGGGTPTLVTPRDKPLEYSWTKNFNS
jgi:hypothetical protein